MKEICKSFLIAILVLIGLALFVGAMGGICVLIDHYPKIMAAISLILFVSVLTFMVHITRKY